MENQNNLFGARDIFASFYGVDPTHVFIVPGYGAAANLAFSTLRDNHFISKIAVPINRTRLMQGILDHFDLNDKIVEGDISPRDFGLDPDWLNEYGGEANCIYARNAHGVASSHVLASHGRLTIEDSMDAPFAPNTGTGDIIYTSLPGRLMEDVSVLIVKDQKYAAMAEKTINSLSLNLHEQLLAEAKQILDRRTDLFYAQVMSAHLLFKLLDRRVQVTDILCHHFKQIPLVLPCDVSSLYLSPGPEYQLLPAFDYLPDPQIHENAHSLMHRTIVVELTSHMPTVNLIGGIAGRINSYIFSKVGDS